MAFDLTKFDPAEADEFIELALTGIEAIAMLLGGPVAAKVTTALAGVRAIVDSLQAAYDGKVSFAQVREEFAKLTTGIEANDARADEALRHKFATSDDTDDIDTQED